ncbi:MAG: HEAT repeat domain-containing protein [Polyangiales bacterium]
MGIAPRRLGLLALVCALHAAVPGHAQDWSLTRERRTTPRAPSTRGPRPTTSHAASRDAERTERPREGTAGAVEEGAAGREATLFARYTALVLADPRSGFALERLLSLYRERDGDLARAVRDFEARLADPGQRFAATLVLAQIALARRAPEEARRRFEEALAERPDSALAHRGLGALAESRGDRAEARRDYARALEATRSAVDRAELERTLGRLAIAEGDFADARARYDSLARGADAFARTEYARALGEAGEHGRAVEELLRLAAASRGDPRAEVPVRIALAREQIAVGDPRAALDTLRTARAAARSQPGLVREIDDARVEAHRAAGSLPELVGELSGSGRRDAATLALLARLLDESGEDERAIVAYERAIAVAPRDVDLRLGLVRVLGRTGRIDALVSAYRGLVVLVPRETRYLVELAEVLRRSGRLPEAIAVADEAGRAAPNDPVLHAALALLFERWGDRERVRREVEQLARIAPDDPANLVALGDLRLGDGDREGARRAFERLRTLSADPLEARLEVGRALARHGLLDEAEAELRAAALLAPDSVPVLEALSDVLEAPRAAETPATRARRDEEAAALLEVVLARSPDAEHQREARRRRVGIAERRGELPARIAGWERDFATDPPDESAGLLLVEAYARLRPPAHGAAERVIGRLVALRPGDVESLAALERLRVSRGDRAGAIEVLAKLVEADPRRATLYLGRMAEHALALYRDEDALRYAREAVERSPGDAVAERRLGDLHRARNELGPAADAYRAVLTADDRQFATALDLAAIEASLGRTNEAGALYLAVLSRCPDDDLVARAGRATLALHVATGRLEELEQGLLPIVLANPRRPLPRKVLVEVYDALVPTLARAVAAGGEGADAARASLARLSGRALFPLLEALADVDPGQRRMAVDVLSILEPPAAAEPLLALAEHPGPFEPRARALVLAARLGSPRLLPRFRALLAGDERRLRGLAAWAVAQHAGAADREALRTLLGDADPVVRIEAMEGLVRLGDRGALPSLRELVVRDRHRAVSAYAALSLGRLGDVDSLERLRLGADEGGLAGLGCLGGLAALGGGAARDAARPALLDSDPDRRRLAAAAFSDHALRFERPSGAPIGASPELGVDAFLRAAAEAAPPGAGEAYADALAATLATALGADTETARSALSVLEVDEGRLDVVARATVFRPLLDAGERPEPELRRRIVRLLAWLDPARAEPFVAARLADPSSEVVAAALSVRRTAPASEEEPVLEGLASPATPFPLRLALVDYLGRQRSAFSDRVLLAILASDPYAVVREAAARAVAGRDPALPALRASRDGDPEPRVRRAAEAALVAGPGASPAGQVTGNDAEIDDR